MVSWKTLQQGAATYVIASFDPSTADKSGVYLSDGKVAMGECAEYAKDGENAEKLWKISEELVGEKFEY
ncbi:hypothetical protein V1506DRAFT_507783 [Lipomyces tetrasporus]